MPVLMMGLRRGLGRKCWTPMVLGRVLLLRLWLEKYESQK